MDKHSKTLPVAHADAVDADRRLLLQAALTLGGCQAIGASVWARADAARGDTVIFADGFEPPGTPIDAVLDLIAAAHAAGQMWVRLDNGTDTFAAAAPSPTYVAPTAGFAPIIYAWASFGWDDTACRIVLYGGGHANTSANQVFTWSAASRGWALAFHGSEHIDMDAGSTNTHRVKGFNDAPVSSHTYCNNVWLRVLQRFFTFGGAAWNDGNVLRVWDAGIAGFQASLRIAGGFSLDLTEAGTGKVAGGTGTNFGPPLPGANAWTLHDWLAPGHASPPVFGGTTYATHIDRGAVATVEGGKDVVYYTAGAAFGLLRTEFVDATPANDVTRFVCSGLGFSGDGEVLSGGNLAMDEADRVIVALARGNGAFQPFRFVDLAAPSPAWTQPGAPAGAVAALKAESKGEPGLLWDPVDGCYVAATRGSIVTPGVFPRQVFRIFKPARSGGLTPATGWSVDLRGANPAEDLPPIGPFGGESFPTVTGKWRWAAALRCGLYLTDPVNGQVWAYIPRNWTDPR